MSAAQSSESPQYRAMFNYGTMNGYLVVQRGFGAAIDHYRTMSCAKYAASQLNAGLASVDPHAIVGCKVVAA